MSNTGQALAVSRVQSKGTFDFFLDLGVLEVPSDSVRLTKFSNFYEINKKKFDSVDHRLHATDSLGPSRILLPGERFHVRAVRQLIRFRTRSEGRMEFLADQGAVHTGMQGLVMVFEQASRKLERGRLYVSFDRLSNLHILPLIGPLVPYLGYRSGGTFDLCLGHFDEGWGVDHTFLCFTEVK